MKEEFIRKIRIDMCNILSENQLNKLQAVLISNLENIRMESLDSNESENRHTDYLRLYLSAKKIEGCSEKTLMYYEATIKKMLNTIDKDICDVTTDDLRLYLADYQEEKHTGKVTIDNIRRILSSFFSWLEDEDYILKSPARRIHKIKTTQVAYSDENGHLIHFYPCTGTGAIWTGNPFSSGHPFRTFVDTGSV